MYKANRRDGLCERSLTMFPVGIDVSKNTLDLCILYDGIKGRIKTRNRFRDGRLSDTDTDNIFVAIWVSDSPVKLISHDSAPG